MRTKEINRLSIGQQVKRGELTQVKAAELLRLSTKQVSRLCATFDRCGPAGLVSKRRGQASNRKIGDDVEARAVELVRELYEDFGPTLARERLLERHGIKLGKETVRRMLMRAGVWLSKDQRIARPTPRTLKVAWVPPSGSPIHSTPPRPSGFANTTPTSIS